MKLADHISDTARRELLEVMESIRPYLRSASLQVVGDGEDEDEEEDESDEDEEEDDTEGDDETEVDEAKETD